MNLPDTDRILTTKGARAAATRMRAAFDASTDPGERGELAGRLDNLARRFNLGHRWPDPAPSRGLTPGDVLAARYPLEIDVAVQEIPKETPLEALAELKRDLARGRSDPSEIAMLAQAIELHGDEWVAVTSCQHLKEQS